jgi:Putative zinc-finger
MSPLCGILRDGLEDYLAERLPAPQRRILREHLAACDACRSQAVARDVSLAFAHPFSPEPTSAADVDAVLASVRAGVAHIEAERRIAGGRRGRRVSAAAAAAAFVLLALTVPGGARRESTVAALPAPAAPVPTQAAAAAPAAEFEAAGMPADDAAPSSGATVYNLNPGAGREEPRVVWIVDRGLDI